MRYFASLVSLWLAVLLVASSLLIANTNTNNLVQQTQAQQSGNIIFRFDDVQDHFANNGTKAVLDLFLQKKVPLVTAIIASNIGKDQGTVSTVQQGIKSGLFEAALHGYRHVDYRGLTPNNQSVSITKGNDVLKQVFGVHPFIFVPPFNAYNNATLQAMRSHDMNIISSALGTESLQKTKANIYNGTVPCGTSETGTTCPQPPFDLSAANDFRVITDGNITQQTNQQLLSQMADNVKSYGYSIVVLHPQDFVFTDSKSGKVVKDQVNPKQLAQLNQLIDLAKKQYSPTSMSDLVKTMKPGSATFEVTATANEPRKVVVLTLDDDWIGQLTNAVPILQKYHYNATFFVTCKGPTSQDPTFARIDHVNDKQKQSTDITTWNNLKLLKSMHFDLENHGMTHARLTNASPQTLQREIVDSKTCFANHLGFNPKVYAIAFAQPENNATVDHYISKAGYEFARVGYGFGEWNSHRFGLPTMSMNDLDKKLDHNPQAILPEFANQLQKAELPVLVYHNINTLNKTEDNWRNSTTTPETFDAEMKYLKDNGYEVHSIGDLTYDTQKGEFKLK